MKLIKPSVTFMSMTPEPLKLIELAGRTAYKSEDKICEGSDVAFSRMLIRRGHESVLEHASASYRFICDRGVSHEVVRHRLVSYTQESTRYCDYGEDGLNVIIPCWMSGYFEDGKVVKKDVCFADDIRYGDYPGTVEIWLCSMLNSEQAYKKLRELGQTPQQARSVLPNSLKTEIVMTGNFRNWRHFLKTRTAPAAHPQMREIAFMLLEDLRARVPVVFDDVATGNEGA